MPGICKVGHGEAFALRACVLVTLRLLLLLLIVHARLHEGGDRHPPQQHVAIVVRKPVATKPSQVHAIPEAYG